MRRKPICSPFDLAQTFSRNVFLDPEQRKAAPTLFRALEAARRMIESGETQPSSMKAAAREILEREPQIRTEYLEIVDPVDVQPVALIDGPVRIAGAIWIGKTRLIDNVAAFAKRL